jgi:tetratricopeptide (TPR) repeat protein
LSASTLNSRPALRRTLRSFLASGLCLLAACASVDNAAPLPETPLVLAAAEATDTPEQPAAPEAEPATPQYGTFSEDVLSRAIIAELAGQRGYDQQALDDYLALARETGNLSIIQRAMRIAVFLRNIPVALEMGRLWLEQEPDSLDAHQAVSLQLVALGRYGEALDHMTFLLDAGEDVDFRLLSARISNDSNAGLLLDALIGDVQDLLARYPEHQTLRLSLAHLYQQNEQIQEAYEVVQRLAKDMDDNPEVVLLEVQLLEMLGENNRAQRRLQQSLRTNPQSKQLRFLYGRKLIEERKYQDAKDQFTIIVEQDPEDYDMVYSLALISMEVNMFGDARNYLQRLVAAGQRTDDAHYYLGFIATQESDDNLAIEHYLQVSGGSNFMQAQRNLTELMVRAGRYEEVKAHLQNIRFRNADLNIPLLTMEANVLMDEGWTREASTLLDSSIAAFQNNIQLLFLRSVLSQQQGNIPLMEQDLRKIIQLNPSSPVAYNTLGYYLADSTDRYEEAYDLILRAIELAPNDPAIIDSLGWVQYRLGMFEEARKNLDKAYELYPDPEVAAHLGEVLWVMGEKAAANRIWRNALQVQPDSEHVLNAMERLNPERAR